MSPGVIKAGGPHSPRHRTTFGADSRRRRGGEGEGGKKIGKNIKKRERPTGCRRFATHGHPRAPFMLEFLPLSGRAVPLAQLTAQICARRCPARHLRPRAAPARPRHPVRPLRCSRPSQNPAHPKATEPSGQRRGGQVGGKRPEVSMALRRR